MKFEELLNLKIEDLKRELDSYRSKLFELKCKNATKQLKNPHLLKEARKDVARLLTCLNNKKIGK
jgi:large subunit ribosomal protein L29